MPSAHVPIAAAGGVGSRIGRGITRRAMLGFLTAAGIAEKKTALAEASGEDAAEFMRALLNRALEVLSHKTSPAERRAEFRRLFHADFDGPGIARFVLGRYWRQASRAEREEFLKLFEDYVVFVYSARLSDFSGETFRIRGSRPIEDTTIVSTDIFSHGATAPLKVDWRLVNDDGAYKIADVIVEGVSLLATERSEIASVIQRHGGQVDSLLALLRQKTAGAAR